jgi:hypothetical protein
MSARRLRRRLRSAQCEIDAARVDHRKFEQAALGEGFDVGESGRAICIGARRQRRWGTTDVHMTANALDDAPVDQSKGCGPPLS